MWRVGMRAAVLASAAVSIGCRAGGGAGQRPDAAGDVIEVYDLAPAEYDVLGALEASAPEVDLGDQLPESIVAELRRQAKALGADGIVVDETYVAVSKRDGTGAPAGKTIVKARAIRLRRP